MVRSIFNKFSHFSGWIIPYNLMLIAFLLSVHLHYSVVCSVILTGFFVFSGVWRNIFYNFKVNYIPLLLCLFWILHAISLIYTKNLDRGLFDLQQKLSLLLFPLVCVSAKELVITFRKQILISFVVGLVLTSLLCFLKAAINSFSFSPDGLVFNPIPADAFWENHFWHYRLSFPRHPTYLSMFYSFGLVVLFWLLKGKPSKKLMVIYYLLVALFLLMIILLTSRSGILIGALVLIVGFLWLYFRRTTLLMKILFLFVVIVSISLFAINNTRFSILLKGLGLNENTQIVKDSQLEDKLMGETLIRLKIWAAIPEVVENSWLFGVGSGDAKEVLLERYKQKGLEYALQNELNAHNQYLQTLLSLGIVGLIILLAVIVMPVIQSFRERNILPMLFLIIIMSNFMVESVFERIAGVLFVSIFYSLLFSMKK